jgi:hypothetical protein
VLKIKGHLILEASLENPFVRLAPSFVFLD